MPEVIISELTPTESTTRMLAVELHPEGGDAPRYCEALQGRGILAKDTHEHTIRIAHLCVPKT
jgi:hypothetical protein